MGLAGVCLAGFFVLEHLASAGQQQEEQQSVRASPATARPKPVVTAGARPVTAASPPLRGAPAPHVQDEAELALQRRLEASKQTLSVPPSGRVPPTRGRPLASSMPPEVEMHRQAALSGWKRTAQALMSSCVVRPQQARQQLAVEVAFSPMPRAQGEYQQVFRPEWIAVPPHELQRLWKDTNPDRLQECLNRTRSLPLEVPLSGDAQAHDFPVFVESLLIQF